ncbi:MAG: hypothetical protein ACK4E3_03645 [Brevundimonas sp.]|uniref:hypothetical protein n=1 Tax=Brevundimonas sp. TaxID=1871086 RepID=UPI00391DDD3D
MNARHPPGWWPRVVNIPRTQTFLAWGVIGAAIHQGQIDWNTALAMVLTFYFTRDGARHADQGR